MRRSEPYITVKRVGEKGGKTQDQERRLLPMADMTQVAAQPQRRDTTRGVAWSGARAGVEFPPLRLSVIGSRTREAESVQADRHEGSDPDTRDAPARPNALQLAEPIITKLTDPFGIL